MEELAKDKCAGKIVVPMWMVRFKFVLDGNKGFDSKYVYFCVIFRVEELVQLPLLSALGQKHHVDPF